MSFLPMITSRQPWRHTHTAERNGRITELSAEPHSVLGVGVPDLAYLLLFERDAATPSWSLRIDTGEIKRLRSNSSAATPVGPGTDEDWDGIVVEVGPLLVER